MNIPRAFATCIVCTFALRAPLGCKVDNRELKGGAGSSGASNTSTGGRSTNGGVGNAHAGEGGAGELPEAAAAGAGTPAAGGAGGATDTGPVAPPLVDGCVDLDENGVGDCTETLLKNASFKLDTLDWTADVGATLGWSDSNAYEDLPSGAGLVASTVGARDVDGLVLASATQCVPVAAGTKLEIIANVFIKPGQGEGLAGISIFFFDQASCMGNIKDSFDTSGAATGTWSTLRGVHTVADGVGSMLVRLTASKPYRSESFEAKFDNILVKSQ